MAWIYDVKRHEFSRNGQLSLGPDTLVLENIRMIHNSSVSKIETRYRVGNIG